MMDSPCSSVVGGMVWVMINFAPGAWNSIFPRPWSKGTGLFVALKVLAGDGVRRKESILGARSGLLIRVFYEERWSETFGVFFWSVALVAGKQKGR